MSRSRDRPEVRRVLDEVLRTDADLEAFCLDFFSGVHRRFAAGMDRVDKINLLLALIEPAKVLDQLTKLKAQDPAAVDQALQDKLEALYQQREAALRSGSSAERLDEEIRALKRQHRQGPRLAAGEILSGRYKLNRIVGSGGFADVWLAWDRQQSQSVAVKVLHGRFTPQHTQWQRFERGARNMAKVSQRHPGFVKVLADPAQDDGYYYFVMEHLPGGDLRKAVLDGRLARKQALGAVLEVGKALHFAHAQGLIHRDVKPQNILLDGRGAARLSDFDLVLASDTTGSTRTGPMGTFIYAAPEELEDAKRVDGRADIYSLGMTAVFVLYGKDLPTKVFRAAGDFVETLECSTAVQTVLKRAIAWDAKDRHETAEAFCKELTAALATRDSPPRSATPKREAATPLAPAVPKTAISRLSVHWKWGLAALLLLTLTISLTLTLRGFRDRPKGRFDGRPGARLPR